MGPAQGKWNPGTAMPITTATSGLTVRLDNAWRDTRPDAVGRCRVDLPVDAPLPDDLDERGWLVVDRTRDRTRWVDVVVLEGDTLPRHVAGEYMTEWRSFDELREAVARALAAAFSPPMPEAEPWPTIAGGTATGMWTNPTIQTTTTTNNTSYLTFDR